MPSFQHSATPSAAAPQKPQPSHMESELPGSKAAISRDSDRLIIELVRKKGLAALLDSWEPLDDGFPEIDDSPLEQKNIF